jgi:hypothetical protein
MALSNVGLLRKVQPSILTSEFQPSPDSSRRCHRGMLSRYGSHSRNYFCTDSLKAWLLIMSAVAVLTQVGLSFTTLAPCSFVFTWLPSVHSTYRLFLHRAHNCCRLVILPDLFDLHLPRRLPATHHWPQRSLQRSRSHRRLLQNSYRL